MPLNAAVDTPWLTLQLHVSCIRKPPVHPCGAHLPTPGVPLKTPSDLTLGTPREGSPDVGDDACERGPGQLGVDELQHAGSHVEEVEVRGQNILYARLEHLEHHLLAAVSQHCLNTQPLQRFCASSTTTVVVGCL